MSVCLWIVTDGERRVGKFLSGDWTVQRAEKPLHGIATFRSGQGRAVSHVVDECDKRGWKCTLHDPFYKPPVHS